MWCRYLADLVVLVDDYRWRITKDRLDQTMISLVVFGICSIKTLVSDDSWHRGTSLNAVETLSTLNTVSPQPDFIGIEFEVVLGAAHRRVNTNPPILTDVIREALIPSTICATHKLANQSPS